ncbi:MAG: hydrogenase maturation nickel metallochaperone HypA [Clostridiales Family XIII bacterium]|jgi:Zn finger protein HypA/HybF involved in hydrogenase expression|nr:hydrogenase maturation nickel metallochaperone HypA [Clostridiales Family XIII bacterium]
MHELSVIMAVVDTVDEYLKARDEDANITRITLQIGKQSSYLPPYIREIWPFAINETSLDGAALDIEELPGKEFFIKEIEIEE